MPQSDSSNKQRDRYVALDRDGTVIVERLRHLKHPDEVELIPGAAAGLRQLMEMGLGLVLVTNQSGIGRGTMNHQSLQNVHNRLQDLLAAQGVSLDGIYACPHTPWDGCRCRKPLPGLLESAAEELDFDLGSSFLIGDKASDIEAGQQAGATTLLVMTGYGDQVAREGTANPNHVVSGLCEAAEVIGGILRGEKTRGEKLSVSDESAN